jgi:RNA polymerase sigma-70 factor (ECF subfamily)
MYARHHRAMYAYTYRRLAATGAEVNDVVAEVFAVAWRRLESIPAPPEDRLWLYGVARRCVARAQRSAFRRGRLEARLLEQAHASADRQPPSAVAVVVHEAIEKLRPGEREAVQLVMWEGLSHAEAGQVLRCSANAVALRLHKARQRLRAELAGWNGVSDEVRTGAGK